MTLRPLSNTDATALWFAETDPALLIRWRHEGRVNPGGESVQHGLYADALCAFVVENSANNAVGIAVVHGAQHHHQTAMMSVACFDPADRQSSLQTLVGQSLLIHYAFQTWDLHKLTSTVPEYNLAPFEGLLDGIAREEGRLREHIRVQGQTWDLVMISVFRDDWIERQDALVATLGVSPIE